MFFEMIDFLDWGWLIAFHLIAFPLIYLPFIWDGAIKVVYEPISKLLREKGES